MCSGYSRVDVYDDKRQSNEKLDFDKENYNPNIPAHAFSFKRKRESKGDSPGKKPGNMQNKINHVPAWRE